jgi:hypothetical protein
MRFDGGLPIVRDMSTPAPVLQLRDAVLLHTNYLRLDRSIFTG